MKIREIVLSFDFYISIFLVIVCFYFFPWWINNQIATKLYEIGISVLSIVFSVFFAALAIIITSPDDDFVKFLEEKEDYTGLVDTFKFSLFSLFVALCYSIILTAITANWISQKHINQQVIFILVYIFLFSYSLLAALISANDAIQFAKYRTVFLKGRE